MCHYSKTKTEQRLLARNPKNCSLFLTTFSPQKDSSKPVMLEFVKSEYN